MAWGTYGRYIPNLTRQDGSAPERQLAKELPSVTAQVGHSGLFWGSGMKSMNWIDSKKKLVEAAGVEPASENIPLKHLHVYPGI